MHTKISVLSIEFQFERTAFRAVWILLAVCVCLYLYLVASSVLSAIARKEALAQSVQLQGSIGDLERSYFELSHSVTPQTAEHMGLAPIRGTNYVYRPGNVGDAGTLRNNTI